MKRYLIIPVIMAAMLAAGCGGGKEKPLMELKPVRGSIAVSFRVTGSVNPRNRLEIKPQVGGRLEEVLVNEGDKVRKGQVLAWMSSTDRAAILDAVRQQGEEAVKEWEDTYKPTPVIAPLNGFIIVRDKEPGQTVGTGDYVLVMADNLIVQADVDETDIRNISLGQRVSLSLDAFPDIKFPGVVEHIAYESKLVSNVTVYQVKIRPLDPPAFFRSGMTATAEITSREKGNLLLVPFYAVTDRNGKKFVTVKTPKGAEEREIKVGISNEKSYEVTSGIADDDTLMVQKIKTAADKNAAMRARNGMGGIFGGGGGGGNRGGGR